MHDYTSYTDNKMCMVNLTATQCNQI